MATTGLNHLQAFFNGYPGINGYPGFTYNPSNPATSEFNRMARLLQWSQYERNENKDYFKDALVKEFNTIYGTDENSLESWQTLCRVLSITPIPETLKVCREKVRGTFVNLVDLVDLPNSNEPIKLFSSELALSNYTKDSMKYFPRENAYAGGLLKFLLRRIANPRTQQGFQARRRGRGI